jgi:hypothetical protein
MRLTKTLRTQRGKETRLRIMPPGCPPGMRCSTTRRLTRGVLGWDTLGGPDRRAGDDHPASPDGQRAPRHHGAPHQLLHPGPAHPDAQPITYPDSGHGVLFRYPSLFAAHAARFPRHRRRRRLNQPASGQTTPPGRCGSGQKTS